MTKLTRLTLLYWMMILSANTIGEAGGDLISMTFGLGYAASTALLIGLYVVAAAAAVTARREWVALYWLVIILSSTAGTTLSDFVTRQLGFGYAWGTALLLVTMVVLFATWWRVAPQRRISGRLQRRTEALYWAAILVSSTLGTASGDLISNGTALGFAGGTLLLAGALGLVALLGVVTRLSRDICYWLAIVICHPLGATAGDYMTKDEGLGLGNGKATLVLIAAFLVIASIQGVRRRQTSGAPAAMERTMASGQ